MSPKNQIPNRCTQLKRYKESQRISHEHHPTFRRNLHMEKRKRKIYGMKILNTTEQLLSKKVFEQNKEQHPWGRGEIREREQTKVKLTERKSFTEIRKVKMRII